MTKFIFEIRTDVHKFTKEDYAILMRMMISFENMVNLTIPRIRVHLEEKE
jgi:hypothetical protein